MIHADAFALQGLRASPPDSRAQLDRILSSSDFEATVRERRFLSHVVEETLSGRGDRIKAYSVAIEVFGRDASFDPQTDPIVRIEAGHLRRSLERYYLTAGQSDPIVISIPKGGYVPTFLPRSSPEQVQAIVAPAPVESGTPRAVDWRHASWTTVVLAALFGALAVLAIQLKVPGVGPAAPEIPRLLVERFEDLSRTEASADITSGLTQEVMGQLSRFKDIVVIEAKEAVPGGASGSPRYALLGSVNLSENAFRLRVRLVNRSDGSVLWANSYDGDISVSQIVKAQGDIATNVATNLAQVYGVIFQADARLDVAAPPDDWAAYSCTLSYYAYRANMDLDVLSEVRTCLEKAVQRFPTYATAWALLAQTYIEDVRFSRPIDPATLPALIDRALVTARKSVELDPTNIRGLQAEMFALSFNRQFEAARHVGERALALNPNDTELMGEFGYRLALSGAWDEGCPMVALARERNPGPLAYYESALALCSYFGRDNEAAMMWIRKTTAPKNPFYHVIAAAIYGEAGHVEGADTERRWLVENTPALVANLRTEITWRLGRVEDVEFLLTSLKKAGLPVLSK